jgi:hypothetical protein
LLKGQPEREFAEPPGMVRVEVCADSGLLPQAGSRIQDAGRQPAPCPRTVTELFIEGTEPTRLDDWHWLYTLDMRNGLLAGPDCPPQFTVQERYTLYPAEAQDWARGQNIPQPPEVYSPLCPGQVAGSMTQETRDGFPAPSSSPLILTSPDQGSRYRLSPEIPPTAQQVVVAARPADGVSLRQVTLLADGQPLATLTQPPYQALWPMTVGTHVFTVMGIDAAGNEVQGSRVTVEVVE